MQLINHLTLHAKGCLRKLDAVQDMLKAQEDQQDNDAGSADSVDYDDGELPLRDIEKPKRIIEVVYVKALELETTINEHLADLTAAGDAAQAAKQVRRSCTLSAMDSDYFEVSSTRDRVHILLGSITSHPVTHTKISAHCICSPICMTFLPSQCFRFTVIPQVILSARVLSACSLQLLFLFSDVLLA